MICHESNELFSPPGDDEINLIFQLEHLPDRFSLRMRKDLDRLLGETPLYADLSQISPILTPRPTKSERRATSRSPSAIPRMTEGVSLNRSINDEERAPFSAAARSFRFSLIRSF